MATIDDRAWMDVLEISQALRLAPIAVQRLLEGGEIKAETRKGEYYARPAHVHEFMIRRNNKTR